MAILTSDTDQLQTFYRDVFDAIISRDTQETGSMRLSFIDVGPTPQLNVFEIDGNDEATRQTPMFKRGRIDHLGLEAASLEAFDLIRERRMQRGSTDGFVTDFGPVLSLFFTEF